MIVAIFIVAGLYSPLFAFVRHISGLPYDDITPLQTAILWILVIAPFIVMGYWGGALHQETLFPSKTPLTKELILRRNTRKRIILTVFFLLGLYTPVFAFFGFTTACVAFFPLATLLYVIERKTCLEKVIDELLS